MCHGACGGLNRNGPYRVMSLNVWGTGRDTVSKCGLVGVGVALLEEMCY